ncbi:MAG: hypothetical protein M3Y56_10260, partial [Armatimonadota bacterium]|nr:hypothetical protein [Armatimonadota bacterium]
MSVKHKRLAHTGFYPLLTALVTLLLSTPPTRAALKPEEVPLFDLRVRVASVAGQEPGDRKFNLTLAGQHAVAEGNGWSDWMSFGLKDATDALKAYPNVYLARYPVVTRLTVDGVVDRTIVEAELRLQEAGEVVPLRGELFGTGLGILLWRDDGGKPQAATMAGYNRQYWKGLEGVQVPASSRPTRFPIVDRFIGGDDDALDWKEGLQALAKAGFSAIMLPPSKPIRQLLLDTGIKRTAWGIYNPPGYAFDYDPKITPAAVHDWAAAQAKPYTDAGYDPK